MCEPERRHHRRLQVDQLTRSLTDFAKLVELFDQHSVSFVSVTQSFNTTTSMGRQAQKIEAIGQLTGASARSHNAVSVVSSLEYLLVFRSYRSESIFRSPLGPPAYLRAFHLAGSKPARHLIWY